ncbi:MAG: hypothetical protein ACE5KG_06890 [Nitrososphaerales archaeon]
MVEPQLFLLDGILRFLGAIVGFAVAFVSYRGYIETKSPTFLRLFVAFAFLGVGFATQGIAGVASSSISSQVAFVAALLIISGAIFQTVGYFFLAFAHVLDVVLSSRSRFPMFIPFFAIGSIATGIVDIARPLSFYFLTYGVAETLIFYYRNRRPDTLIIASGLVLLALGEFFGWLILLQNLSTLFTTFSLVVKLSGLFLLVIPVMRFAFRRRS